MKNYKKGFINVLVALSIGALAVVSGALIQKYTHPQTVIPENKSGIVGAVPTFTSGKVYTLYGGGISSTDTSIKLSSFLQPVSGQPILTADLIQGVGASFYITIEPSTNRKETVGCNVVTQNGDGTATLSGCTRGYMFTFPYTASTTLRLSHSGGSRVVLSDSPQLYNDIISYVNTITAAGVVDSSATAKGIVEKATAAEAAANKAVGSGNTSAPLALTTDIASSSRVVNTSVVVVASSTTGYIDNSFISTSTLLYPAIIPSQTPNGTTTMATTTFNGFTPWGLIAKGYATSSSSFTLSFPARENIRIEYVSSTTDIYPTYLFFNGDKGLRYIAPTSWSASSATNTIMAGSLDASAQSTNREYYVMDILNVAGESKLINISYSTHLAVSTNAMLATSTARVWTNSQEQITSITVRPYNPSGATNTFHTAGTYIKVYGDLFSPL